MDENDETNVWRAISDLRRFCPPVVVNQVLTVIEAYERLVRQQANSVTTVTSVTTPLVTDVVTAPSSSKRDRAAYMRAYRSKSKPAA